MICLVITLFYCCFRLFFKRLCSVTLLLAIFSSLSFLHLSRGSFETTSLPPSPRGSAKVYVNSTLPRPHLWDFNGYAIVLVPSLIVFSSWFERSLICWRNFVTVLFRKGSGGGDLWIQNLNFMYWCYLEDPLGFNIYIECEPKLLSSSLDDQINCIRGPHWRAFRKWKKDIYI